MVEQIVAQLLNNATVKAEASNIALAELPQGTDYPAIVYQAISVNTLDYLCQHGKNQTARVQVNALAKTMGKVNSIHEVVKTALVGFSPRVVAGKKLASVVFVGFGPIDKDEAGIWTKPADYRFTFE
jgi:hypothetical protein